MIFLFKMTNQIYKKTFYVGLEHLHWRSQKKKKKKMQYVASLFKGAIYVIYLSLY